MVAILYVRFILFVLALVLRGESGLWSDPSAHHPSPSSPEMYVLKFYIVFTSCRSNFFEINLIKK